MPDKQQEPRRPPEGGACEGPTLPALLQTTPNSKLEDWQKAVTLQVWLRARWQVYVPFVLSLLGLALNVTAAILGWRGEPREAVLLAGGGVALILTGLTVAVAFTNSRKRLGCSVRHGLCHVLGVPLSETLATTIVVGGAWVLGAAVVARCAWRLRKVR